MRLCMRICVRRQAAINARLWPAFLSALDAKATLASPVHGISSSSSSSAGRDSKLTWRGRAAEWPAGPRASMEKPAALEVRASSAAVAPHRSPRPQDSTRALSLTRAAQWASSAGRSANVPPAPLAHGLGREFRVEDALGRFDQIGLGPLPEEPRALVGRKAHAGALALGKGPGLPWDFQQSFALPKQRLQAQELASLSTSTAKFHMLFRPGVIILFCLRLKKGWSEPARASSCWW